MSLMALLGLPPQPGVNVVGVLLPFFMREHNNSHKEVHSCSKLQPLLIYKVFVAF